MTWNSALDLREVAAKDVTAEIERISIAGLWP